MPIVNPTQSTTTGGDFYLAVLPDMSPAVMEVILEEVQVMSIDGEQAGLIKWKIQAVCAGCQGNNDFPTTPNVYSSVNGSSGCNLGAFKLDLESIYATISFTSYFLPSNSCFNNLSQGGNQYFWDFGDGNTSNAIVPSYLL